MDVLASVDGYFYFEHVEAMLGEGPVGEGRGGEIAGASVELTVFRSGVFKNASMVKVSG